MFSHARCERCGGAHYTEDCDVGESEDFADAEYNGL